jgi:hypothetical protein
MGRNVLRRARRRQQKIQRDVFLTGKTGFRQRALREKSAGVFARTRNDHFLVRLP